MDSAYHFDLWLYLIIFLGELMKLMFDSIGFFKWKIDFIMLLFASRIIYGMPNESKFFDFQEIVPLPPLFGTLEQVTSYSGKIS